MNALRLGLCIAILIIFLSCEQDHIRSESEAEEVPALELDSSQIRIASEIDSLFNDAFRDGEFAAAGVSVVMGNLVVYEKGVGYKNADEKARADEHTIFRVGSLSKSFTGALCEILAQNYGLPLDTSVADVLSSFSLVDSTSTKQVRLSHLLSHTAGLPYHSYTNLVEDGLSMKKIIPYFQSIGKLEKAGDQYSYQNAAYGLIGTLLEELKGARIQDLFNDHLFIPLGMTSSSCTSQDFLSSRNVAMPHERGPNSWSTTRFNKKYYNAVTAGGVNTSAHDMSSFLKLLLGGRPDLLNSDHISEMTRPYIRTKVGYRYYKQWESFDDSFYGHGWRIHTFRNATSSRSDTLIHHGGLVNSYRSEVAFHRDENFAISVLFNCNTPRSRTIIPEVIEIIRRHKKSAH